VFSFLWKKKQEKPEEEEVPNIVYEYEDVSEVMHYFEKETGITFEQQKNILKNKLTLFCKTNKIYSFKELLNSLKKDDDIKQKLINVLTTNETYFYREFSQIQAIVEHVKKRVSSTPISILCAPCATGEEPYSIAIALGNLDEKLVRKYFDVRNKKYILNERVKQRVSFLQKNIFKSEFTALGKFDYVFSRNMLIYFDKETKLKAKSILESMQKDPNVGVFFGHADLF